MRTMRTETVEIHPAVAVMGRDEARAEHARMCALAEEGFDGHVYDGLVRRLRLAEHARGHSGWRREAGARLARLQAVHVANGGQLGGRIARRFQDQA